MKRLLFTLLVFGIALSAKPQSVLPQTAECVTCLNNEIHTRRFASAIGTNNVSIGERSFAGGINSQATGNYSFAFGEDVKATQRSSFAFGYLSEANGAFSAAIGRMAITSSSALHAMAFGYSVEANASASFVAGRFLRAAASNTIVLGGGYGTNDPLINNIPRSLMVGFNSNVPTLFVGESSGVGTTGNIGIGNVTNPAAKLHIKADNNKDATLRLEPTGSVNVARIEFGSNASDYFLSVNPSGHMSYSVPEGKNFVFQNGKIVATAIRISQGAAANRILKSDATGNALWEDPEWTTTLNNNLVRLTGSVGIGFITEPDDKLHVEGFVRSSDGYKVGTHIVINSTRDFFGRNGNFSGSLSVTGSGNSTFAGNVGIGTTTPQAKLEIVQTPSENALSVNSGTTSYSLRINDDGSLQFRYDNNTRLTIRSNGEIKTQKSLFVDGYLISENLSDHFLIRAGTNENVGARILMQPVNTTKNMKGSLKFYTPADGWIEFHQGGQQVMNIREDKNIYVGWHDNESDIYVRGEVHAKKFRATYTPWPDYVFDPLYMLPQLDELEKFIYTHRHLPGLPPAAQVEKEGFELAEMNALLLKKIEELTLYVIEQQKQINALNQRFAETE